MFLLSSNGSVCFFMFVLGDLFQSFLCFLSFFEVFSKDFLSDLLIFAFS